MRAAEAQAQKISQLVEHDAGPAPQSPQLKTGLRVKRRRHGARRAVSRAFSTVRGNLMIFVRFGLYSSTSLTEITSKMAVKACFCQNQARSVSSYFFVNRGNAFSLTRATPKTSLARPKWRQKLPLTAIFGKFSGRKSWA